MHGDPVATQGCLLVLGWECASSCGLGMYEHVLAFVEMPSLDIPPPYSRSIAPRHVAQPLLQLHAADTLAASRRSTFSGRSCSFSPQTLLHHHDTVHPDLLVTVMQGRF